MQTIKISNQQSTILIGENYQNIDKYIQQKRCFLICDENIKKYYSDFVDRYPHIIIGTGENIKNWDTVSLIIEKLLDMGADRHSFLLGMGGGVVCDITGFVASVYMRGIQFGFISTSLLSQVDASLGGKNGINFGKLKNMIGVFNPPQFVICDPKLLKTLPERQVKSGFGEIIKHALIRDPKLYDFLISNREELLSLNTSLMEELIYRAISVKAAVVEADPLEQGERKILNFGHTLGHAIENNSNLTHGEAVSVGIMLASLLSHQMGLLSHNEVILIRDLLESYDLPISTLVNCETIIKYLEKDKKKEMDKIHFVLLESIGKTQVNRLPISELNRQVASLCYEAVMITTKKQKDAS